MLIKFNKYIFATIATFIVAIGVVLYMYSKNFITVSAEIHFYKPSAPSEKYIEKKIQPADTYEYNKFEPNVPASRVAGILPKSEDTKEPRVFDDIMKVTETVMPLVVVLIPLYYQKKNKKKSK